MGRLDSIRRRITTSLSSKQIRSKEERVAGDLMVSKMSRQSIQRSKRRGQNEEDGYGNSDHGDSRTENELDLGEYTQVSKDAIHNMLGTCQTIKRLADEYTRHVEGIEKVARLQRDFDKLLQQSRSKDDKIKSQKITIQELKCGKFEEEQKLSDEKQSLAEERMRLEIDIERLKKDKEQARKRLEAQEAELKLKSDKELEGLKNKCEREFKDRQKSLDAELQSKKKLNEKQVVDLQKENSMLLDKLKGFQELVDKQKEKLALFKETCEDHELVKSSLKEKIRSLESKLQLKQNEFGLGTEAPDFYKTKFVDISKKISEITAKYFRNLHREEDPETIHHKLLECDIGFIPIPISDSEESKKLRMACAQQVISSTLCNTVWQPFSAGRTASHPDLSAVLGEISATLAEYKQGNCGKRSANVWSALTTRALHVLSSHPPHPQTASTKQTPPQSYVDMVVEKIFSKLKSLISPSQASHLRNDLSGLIRSAISVWSSAQTNELQITVQLALHHANREDWRSSMFDPITEGDDNPSEVISHGARILTLFPRIVASRFVESRRLSMPGGFSDTQPEPEVVETCIHPGIGLPEWSELVVSGQEELEEAKMRREEAIVQEKLMNLEKQKQELEARSGRNGMHSRNGSVTGPKSPTLSMAWMREGVKKVPEEE